MVHSSPIPPLRGEEVTRFGSRVSSPTRVPSPNRGSSSSATYYQHHLHQGYHNSSSPPPSKIPVPVRRDSRAVGAVERAPSPMPRPRFLALMEEINSKYGMSRHGKTSGSAPAAPSTGTSHASTTPSSAVPVPVAQQAQQYLEQNIKAWMQPKNQDLVLPPSNAFSASPTSTFIVQSVSTPRTPTSNRSPAMTSSRLCTVSKQPVCTKVRSARRGSALPVTTATTASTSVDRVTRGSTGHVCTRAGETAATAPPSGHQLLPSNFASPFLRPCL